MSLPETLVARPDASAHLVARFRVAVVTGRDAGAEAVSVDGRLTVGTAEGVTLRLTDPTVSRVHAECEVTPQGIAVRDLGSTNGTRLGAALVREVTVAEPVLLDVGRTRLRLSLDAERTSVAAAREAAFGELLGASLAMRTLYSVLERTAPTSAPVLITGESGTGKELAARALHLASPRAAGPFEVINCGGLPPTLAESELFGHERGAFTGATGERAGAFERADGGTLFLDELGEMPLDLQAKVLRALGEGEVRRVGGKRALKVDVRVVTATNRDLRYEINAGRFRADLFYRLAVIQVRMPPLRERLEDLAILVPSLVTRVARERGIDAAPDLGPDLLRTLAQHSWPGNVRELKNYLVHLLILQSPPPFEGGASPSTASPDPASVDLLEGLDTLPLRAAKNELLERFERRYLSALLEETGGNVAEAARRSGVDRVTLFRIIRRTGLRE